VAGAADGLRTITCAQTLAVPLLSVETLVTLPALSFPFLKWGPHTTFLLWRTDRIDVSVFCGPGMGEP
jgi:hypothetical protein